MGRPNTAGLGPNIEMGTRIKKAFENAGYGDKNNKEIGKMVGLKEGQVGKIFNGWRAPSLEALIRIAIATNSNVEWLATGRGTMVYSLTGGTIDISRLPAEKQEAAREMIKTLEKL